MRIDRCTQWAACTHNKFVITFACCTRRCHVGRCHSIIMHSFIYLFTDGPVTLQPCNAADQYQVWTFNTTSFPNETRSLVYHPKANACLAKPSFRFGNYILKPCSSQKQVTQLFDVWQKSSVKQGSTQTVTFVLIDDLKSAKPGRMQYCANPEQYEAWHASPGVQHV